MRRIGIGLIGLIVLVWAGSTESAAQFIVRRPPAVAAGGCVGTCYATSFTVAQGWTTDHGQVISGGGTCGGLTAGFANVQTWSGAFTGPSDGGSQVVAAGACAQITTTANYASGAGGRGFSQRYGNGTNSNSGGMNLSLPSTVTKLDVRYFVRYPVGMTVTAYIKEWGDYTPDAAHYLDAGLEGDPAVGNTYPGFNSAGSNGLSAPGHTFAADGSFHCVEYQVNPGTGYAAFWYDGTKLAETSSQNFGAKTQLAQLQLGVNASSVGGCPSPNYCAVDYDDFILGTTQPDGTPIGCAASAG